MTKFVFLQNIRREIIGFTAGGHAGFAIAGKDIVCAAVSSAAQLLELQLKNLLGSRRGAFYKRKAGALMRFEIPEDLAEQEKDACFLLTGTFYQFILQLEKQYPKQINVVKRRENHAEN